jgi:uncharacterized protein
MVKYLITYTQYEKLVNRLINQLKKLNIKFDWVYGIPRGGLPLAVELSHKLNINFAMDSYIFDIENKYKNILVVDDLVDTGHTMKNLSQNVFYEFPNISTAVLFKKPWSDFQPTYFIEETDRWIVFPYEDPEEDILERCEDAMSIYIKENGEIEERESWPE